MKRKCNSDFKSLLPPSKMMKEDQMRDYYSQALVQHEKKRRTIEHSFQMFFGTYKHNPEQPLRDSTMAAASQELDSSYSQSIKLWPQVLGENQPQDTRNNRSSELDLLSPTQHQCSFCNIDFAKDEYWVSPCFDCSNLECQLKRCHIQCMLRYSRVPLNYQTHHLNCTACQGQDSFTLEIHSEAYCVDSIVIRDKSRLDPQLSELVSTFDFQPIIWHLCFLINMETLANATLVVLTTSQNAKEEGLRAVLENLFKSQNWNLVVAKKKAAEKIAVEICKFALNFYEQCTCNVFQRVNCIFIESLTQKWLLAAVRCVSYYLLNVKNNMYYPCPNSEDMANLTSLIQFRQ